MLGPQSRRAASDQPPLACTAHGCSPEQAPGSASGLARTRAQPVTEVTKTDLSCVKTCIVGAAPLGQSTIDAFKRAIPSCDIGQGCARSDAIKPA
jgi:hypothetical protein